MAYPIMKKALLASILAIGPTFAMAADAPPPPATIKGASGEMLASTCAGCHGTNGQSGGPATPSIAGLSKDYFKEVMKGYKSDEIKSTIMGRLAKGYSEGEIEAMAEVFSKAKFLPTKQTADAALAATGNKLHEKYCEKCHAEGGSSATDDSGILAGQPAPYLRWTLSDFLDGRRNAPKKMAKKLEELNTKEGAKGLDALVQFYAGKQ